MQEEPSQAPSEGVMDDLMSALGSCAATVYHAATRLCGVATGQSETRLNTLSECQVYQQGPVQGQRGTEGQMKSLTESPTKA